MSEQDARTRVSAVMDQMVAERERSNRERGKLQDPSQSPVAEQFIPTTREVNEALQARYGQGMSFRDLVPLVANYVRENEVLRRLRPRASQHYQETPEEEVEAPPKRIRAQIDRGFGAMEAQRKFLTGVLADEVALVTEALQRRIGTLEGNGLELRRQLADQNGHMEALDAALSECAAALSERDQETARRMAAEAVVAETEQRAAAAMRERDAAMTAKHAAEEAHQATQARCDELMAHAARLSGELERTGREREESLRQIAELTTSLNRITGSSAPQTRATGGKMAAKAHRLPDQGNGEPEERRE